MGAYPWWKIPSGDVQLDYFEVDEVRLPCMTSI
jgi:hypothetical protein